LPPHTLAELRDELAQLASVRARIKAIEARRLEELRAAAAAPRADSHAMILMLARVLGLGIETADLLVHEILSRACATGGRSPVTPA